MKAIFALQIVCYFVIRSFWVLYIIFYDRKLCVFWLLNGEKSDKNWLCSYDRLGCVEGFGFVRWQIMHSSVFVLLEFYLNMKICICSYRTNYFILITVILGKLTKGLQKSSFFIINMWTCVCVCVFRLLIFELWIVGLGFIRRPLAIVAAFLTALSIAFLNDRYAFVCKSACAWVFSCLLLHACLSGMYFCAFVLQLCRNF